MDYAVGTGSNSDENILDITFDGDHTLTLTGTGADPEINGFKADENSYNISLRINAIHDGQGVLSLNPGVKGLRIENIPKRLKDLVSEKALKLIEINGDVKLVEPYVYVKNIVLTQPNNSILRISNGKIIGPITTAHKGKGIIIIDADFSFPQIGSEGMPMGIIARHDDFAFPQNGSEDMPINKITDSDNSYMFFSGNVFANIIQTSGRLEVLDNVTVTCGFIKPLSQRKQEQLVLHNNTTINGVVGSQDDRFGQIIFIGKSKLTSEAFAEEFRIADDAADVTINESINGDLIYLKSGKLTADKGITGDIDFEGNEGVLQLADGGIITGNVDSSTASAGTLEFLGNGTVDA